MSSIEALKPLFKSVGTVIVQLVTLPYYRLFHFNTLQPIRRIAACASNPAETRRLVRLMFLWRTRKLVELQYISVASAVVAAIVTSSFSWTEVSSAYWLAPGLWYCSLLLAILGILISSQQIAVLDILGPPHPTGNLRKAEEEQARKSIRRFLPLMLSETRHGIWEPRWKMIFVWQCGCQFLSYAVFLYMIGLTLYVCSPLIFGNYYGPEAYPAYLYLGLASLAICSFTFCAFWIYHYVDLESDAECLEDMQSDGNEKGTQTFSA